MMRALYGYAHGVEAVNRRIGRITMYLIFVMMAVLLYSSFSKVVADVTRFADPAAAVNLPNFWTLEIAQFIMVTFYILGGPYSLQLGSNVRMDLLYGSWSDRTKAWADALTVSAMIFFLCVLLYGGLSSLAYSLGYYGMEPMVFYRQLIASVFTGETAEVLGRFERSPTAWRPYLWPIKTIMCFGFVMMLLQATAELIKDIARIRGEKY